jgi:hypothetical protein
MPRLPLPGNDADQWGALLNEFLRVAHHDNGTLRGVSEVINVRDFGAIGDGKSHPLSERYHSLAEAQAVYPHATSLTNEIDWAAILAAQETEREHTTVVQAIYFPPGVYRMGHPATLISPLSFAYGARIQLHPSVMITIDQRSTVIASPNAPIFDVTTSSSDQREPGSIRMEWRGTLYANWWSGGDIGEQWNNMVKSINRLGNDARDRTPRMLAIAPGAYDLTTPMDMTFFRSAQHFDFRGVQLFANVPNRCAMDLTGSTGCTLWSPHITSTGCAIGLLESRPENDGRSSGKQTIIAPHIGGVFTIAAYYNCAAEESKIFGGRIDNQNGRYAAYWGREVHSRDREDFKTITPYHEPGNSKPEPGAESATGYNVFGTQITGTTTEGTIYVWGFHRLSLDKIYATASNKPHLVIDASDHWSSLGPFVDEIYCHGDQSGLPETCIEIKGVSPNIKANPVNHFRLSARQLAANDWALRVGPTELNFCEIRYAEVADITCDAGTRWLDSHLHLRGLGDTPVNLGGEFLRSELIMGDLNKLILATRSMKGSVVRGTDGSADVPPRDHLTEVRVYGENGLTALTYAGYPVQGLKGPNLTASDATLTVENGSWYYLPKGTLNTDRTVTLAPTRAIAGNVITIVREDTSAHMLTVVDGSANGSPLLILPGARRGGARFKFDGTMWELFEYNPL